MDEERKEYLKQYKKENLKRIVLDVKKDVYEQIKLAADASNKTVSRYIKELIAEDLAEKEESSIAFNIERSEDGSMLSTLDYYRSAPSKRTERVIFPAYNAAGQRIGSSVALLTTEEAAKYREVQKKTGNN